MRNNCWLKTVGCISAAIALGILIQIFLPDILIIAICCALIILMGLVIAKLM